MTLGGHIGWGPLLVPSLKRPKTTQHLFAGPLRILEPILVQDVVLFKARGLLCVSLLNASFTRKDKMHSSKVLLYYIYILVQICAALAAPNLAGLARPREAANGLQVGTPFAKSDADGQLKRRQVRSRLFPQSRFKLTTGPVFEDRACGLYPKELQRSIVAV